MGCCLVGKEGPEVHSRKIILTRLITINNVELGVKITLYL